MSTSTESVVNATRHRRKRSDGIDAGKDETPHWRKPAYTLVEFCSMYGIHESTYHRWRHAGMTPDVCAVAGRRYITENARAAWHQQHFGDE